MINQLDEDRRLAIILTQILGLSYADAAGERMCHRYDPIPGGPGT